jgi:hypothetical protein
MKKCFHLLTFKAIQFLDLLKTNEKMINNCKQTPPKIRGKGITPPPPLGDNEHASIAETSTTPIVKELIKQIEKLNVELTKLKTKKDKKECLRK